MMKLILMTVVILSTLTACGSKETSTTSGGNLEVASKYEGACPEGYAIELVGDMKHELCANNDSVILPYVTEEMATECKSYGGGSACNDNVWAIDFATSIINRSSLCDQDMYYDVKENFCKGI